MKTFAKLLVRSTEQRAAQSATRRLLMMCVGVFMVSTHIAFAAVPPWVTAVDNVQGAMTGPIARGLSLVAIVIGGISIAMDDGGGSKRLVGGIIFGVAMAVGAVNFLAWLF